MVNKFTIGEKIKSRSAELGLSDAEVARRTRIEYRNYAHYAAGSRTPPYDALYKICGALGVTPNYFFSIKEGNCIDKALLEKIIFLLEKVLLEESIILSPSKKSQSIVLLYDHVSGSKKTDEELQKETLLIIKAILSH